MRIVGGLFGVAALAGALVVAWPEHAPSPHARYTARDARAAFAAVGIVLTPRSRSASVTTLGNRGDVLEVDAFGDRRSVQASGFSDYVNAGGRHVHVPARCGTSVPDAERWRGNVRVVVSCTAAGPAAAAWLARVDRALSRLS